MKVFIPAAGFGSRLRPLTEHFPKPLLPVAGVPMVSRVVADVVAQLDVDAIGMNTHHLGQQILDWAAACPWSSRITVFEEEPILGTGGALWNARDFLGDGTFVVANADVLTQLDYGALWEAHRASYNMITLGVHPFAHEAHVGVDETGAVVCIGKQDAPAGVVSWVGFTTVAVYEPECLGYLPAGESHVVAAWRAAIADGHRVGTHQVGEVYWRDVGTLESYVQANWEVMEGEGMATVLAEPLRTPAATNVSGYVCIESDVELGDGASLHDVIALPGADIDENADLDGAIVGPGFVVDVAVVPELCWPDSAPRSIAQWLNVSQGSIMPLGKGGGTRRYYRTTTNKPSRVIMHYALDDPDMARQVAFATYFKASGVPVPAIHAHDLNRRLMEQDDLGDETLTDRLQAVGAAERDELLRRALTALRSIQALNPQGCDLIAAWRLDEAMLRWETDYCLERFVVGLLGVDEREIPDAVRGDLNQLASEVNALPVRTLHRDFQSQNIMLHDDDVTVIDFQGARLGPPLYDVASLLRDPYLAVPTADTAQLLLEHAQWLVEQGWVSADTWEADYLRCAVQRHMQALGAYGFLSRVRGLAGFRRFVPAAFGYLREEVLGLHEQTGQCAALNSFFTGLTPKVETTLWVG